MLKGTLTRPSHEEKQKVGLCHKPYLIHVSKSHKGKYLSTQGSLSTS